MKRALGRGQIGLALLRLFDDALLQIAGRKCAGRGGDIGWRAARPGQDFGAKLVILVTIIAGKQRDFILVVDAVFDLAVQADTRAFIVEPEILRPQRHQRVVARQAGKRRLATSRREIGPAIACGIARQFRKGCRTQFLILGRQRQAELLFTAEQETARHVSANIGSGIRKKAARRRVATDAGVGHQEPAIRRVKGAARNDVELAAQRMRIILRGDGLQHFDARDK